MAPAVINREETDWSSRSRRGTAYSKGQSTPSRHDIFKSEAMSSTGSSSLNATISSVHHEEFFQLQPCIYSHEVFRTAAQIYMTLTPEREESGDHSKSNEKKLVNFDQFDNDVDKRLTFELAFLTLKYGSILEFILENCAFFALYPQFSGKHGLVMVVFYDFQNRKFQRRVSGDDFIVDPEILQLEESLSEMKTKLQASLARRRIKHQALTIDNLLPEEIRNKENCQSKSPVTAWANQLKATIEYVETTLIDDGFKKKRTLQELSEMSFCIDEHMNDLFIFSPDTRDLLTGHSLIQQGMLVLQDKSSCLGPHSIAKLIKEGDDVIHVNAGLAVTSAHIASLVGKTCKIYAFGSSNEKDFRKSQTKLRQLGASNVKLIQQNFNEMSLEEQRLKNCKVILITAACSRTAIRNPIDFIVNEGFDINILRDVSFGTNHNEALAALVTEQLNVLKKALRFSRIYAVLYQTYSVNDLENEIVCVKAIEYINHMLQKRVPYRISPPVVPLSSDDIECGKWIDGELIKLKSNEINSGSFMATIARDPESAKESAQDILKHAESKGLLKSAANDKSAEAETKEVETNKPVVEEEKEEDIIKAIMRGDYSADVAASVRPREHSKSHTYKLQRRAHRRKGLRSLPGKETDNFRPKKRNVVKSLGKAMVLPQDREVSLMTISKFSSYMSNDESLNSDNKPHQNYSMPDTLNGKTKTDKDIYTKNLPNLGEMSKEHSKNSQDKYQSVHRIKYVNQMGISGEINSSKSIPTINSYAHGNQFGNKNDSMQFPQYKKVSSTSSPISQPSLASRNDKGDNQDSRFPRNVQLSNPVLSANMATEKEYQLEHGNELARLSLRRKSSSVKSMHRIALQVHSVMINDVLGKFAD